MVAPPHFIYKYLLSPPVTFHDKVKVDMPEGAKVIAVRVQRGEIYVWAVVQPARPLAPRWFRILPTGFTPFDPIDLRHLGTVEMDSGHIFHVFIQE